MKITVFCYGKETEYADDLLAFREYMEGVAACEGAERDRYINICSQIDSGNYYNIDGKKYAIDDISEFCLKHKDYHECKYCGGLAAGPDPNVLCDECRQDFGHTYYSEL